MESKLKYKLYLTPPSVEDEAMMKRVANSHVDSVTPFRSMILSCQRSPYFINIQLRRRFVGSSSELLICLLSVSGINR